MPLAIVLVAALTACQSAKPPTSPVPASDAPSTSASQPATQPPASAASPPVTSAAPSPSAASPKPGQLRPESFASVTTEGLRVRSKPFVGDASRKLEPLLWKGALLFVIDGPVSGSGYDWYLVEPLGEVDVQIHPDPPALGWVAAASRDGERWLDPFAMECFDTPLGWLAFDLLEAPIGHTALSCFGDRTLRFRASLSVASRDGCADTTGSWTIDPTWLAPCQDPVYRLADPNAEPTEEVHALEVTIAPSVDLRSVPDPGPGQWLLVDVVGQYAHPAANTCRAVPTGGDGEGPPPPELIVLQCRERFVVTSLTVNGDP